VVADHQEDEMARYDDDYASHRSRRTRHDDSGERFRNRGGSRSGTAHGGESGGSYGQHGGREEFDDPRSERYAGGRRSGEYDDWEQYGDHRGDASRGYGESGTRRGQHGGWFAGEERSGGERFGAHGSYGSSEQAGGRNRGYGEGLGGRYGVGGGMSGRYGGSGADSAVGAGMTSGGMTGKGPKGYKRSDDRIKENVCDCLTDDPHLDASSLEVQVKDGEVTLTGTVDSRDARRHAEDLIEHMSGVKHVQNNLRVQEKQHAAGKQ
jgi:hypothetical protein